MKLNNKEMSVCETQTSLNNAEVTDVKSVPLSNYTINNKARQDSTKCENSNIINSVISKFPLEDTDNYSNDYNIIRLNGMLHAYQNDVYSNDMEQIETNVYNTLKENTTDVALEDITKTIKTIQYETKDHEKIEISANYVPFNNCILDTETFTAKDFCSELIVTNKLGINFDEATINSANIELINSIFKIIAPDPKMQQFLLSIIGAGCFRKVVFPLAFVLIGNLEHRRIFTELFSKIGGNSISYESLSQLSNIKSSFALYSKTCNISDEVERPQIANMSNLRKIIQGKEIKVTKLFSNSYFKPFATLIINVGEILDFGNALFGLKDFFKIIPFNSKRSVSNKMLDELFTEANLQYIAFNGIKAYLKALRVKSMNFPSIVEIETDKYFSENNSVKQFCKDNPILEIQYKSVYFDSYCAWCVDNNVKRLSRAHFGIEVKKFGYTPKRYYFNKQRYNFYVTENFDIDKCRKKYEEYLQNNHDFSTSPIKDKNVNFLDSLATFLKDYDSQAEVDTIINSNNSEMGSDYEFAGSFDSKTLSFGEIPQETLPDIQEIDI